MAQYVDVHLDKPRRIRYTINGIRELERHFGKSFSQIFDAGSMGYEEIIMLLTIGLKFGETDRRALTDTAVGDIVQKRWLDNGKDLGELTDLIIEAMQSAGIISKKEIELDDNPSTSDQQAGGGKKDLPNV